MSIAKELSIAQFRNHTPARLFGFDGDGAPVLVGPFMGATADDPGLWGYVPAPLEGQQDFVLHGDGTWKDPADTIFNNASSEFDIPATDADGDLMTSGLYNPIEGRLDVGNSIDRQGNLVVYASAGSMTVDREDASTNIVRPLFTGLRRSSGTPANGIGASVVLQVENSAGTLKNGSIEHTLANAIVGSSRSLWTFRGVNADVDTRMFAITGNGDIELGDPAGSAGKRTVFSKGTNTNLEFDSAGGVHSFSALGVEHLRYTIGGGGFDRLQQMYAAKLYISGYDATALNAPGFDVDIFGGNGNGSGADGSVNIYTQGTTGNPWVRITRPMLKADSAVADQGAGSAYFVSSSRFAFLTDLIIGNVSQGAIIAQDKIQPAQAPATGPVTAGFDYRLKGGNGNTTAGFYSDGGNLFVEGGDAGQGMQAGSVFVSGGIPISGGKYGNLGLFTLTANFQTGERVAYWGNRVADPTDAPVDGVFLLAKDVAGSSEFFVRSESGPLLNISGLADPLEISGTTLTLDDALHRGKVLWCSHASGCVVTVPTSLKIGFNCVLVQDNTNVVSLTGPASLNGKTATTGQYDTIALMHYKPSNIYIGI
ncbi:MAG: hypothetical protein QM762_12725 [Chryseolinea sp.]